jgi:hypothetical protein
MADGRLFTDYRPRCDVNYVLPEGPGLDSYTYRQFLINNADKLMSTERAATYKQAMCGPCVEPYTRGTMLPEASITTCDKKTCRTLAGDPSGLGLGRSYGETPDTAATRVAFLQTKAQEQAALKTSGNCCASPDVNFYSPSRMAQTESSVRPSVPSGGVPLMGGDAR